MVHYHRSHQPRKTNTDEESQNTVMLDCSTSAYYKRTRPKLLSFLFLITFLSCCYVFAPLFLGPSFPLSLLCKYLTPCSFFCLSLLLFVLIFFSCFSDSPATENDVNRDGVDANDSPCSSVSTGKYYSCSFSFYNFFFFACVVCFLRGLPNIIIDKG